MKNFFKINHAFMAKTTKLFTLLVAIVAGTCSLFASSFTGFDARTTPLGEQIAAGLATDLVNITFLKTSEGIYSANLVAGGQEGSFSFGGVVFAYTNSADGATAYKIHGSYIQPNGKNREIRIPAKKDEIVRIVLTEACEDILVDGVSTAFAAGENFLIASKDSIILKTVSTSIKPKIQAIGGIVTEGTCGVQLTWKVSTDKVLTISGTGSMYDYSYNNNVPWSPLHSIIASLIIENGVTSIGDYAFSGCSGLTSVTIPNSVTSIGGSAFDECSSLTSVTIPNSVTSIGKYAFYKCTGLTSVTIPNSVTSIGDRAFNYCSSLTSVEAPAVFFDVPEGDGTGYTKILNQVTVIGGELTENALLLINRSYKTLQTLDVSGVTNTEFADEAFKGCYNLQQLVLPAGLQKVGYMMVAGCKNLQSINIPASVEEIEQSAFEDCRSIQTITFGGLSAGAPGRFNAPAAYASQLKKIGNWAFYNAHELQHLDIPEGVTEIGDGAFYGCTYLEDMTLPASVQSIGDNCFALCAKLTKITCNAVTPPTIQAKTFFDVKRQIPVYVPDEAVSAYEGDTYWQEFDIQGQSKAPQGLDNTPFPSGEGRGEASKILHNGQIFILRGEKVYTLQGQEVK